MVFYKSTKYVCNNSTEGNSEGFSYYRDGRGGKHVKNGTSSKVRLWFGGAINILLTTPFNF